MVRVGVLIFTDKAKERVFKTKDYYEAKKNWGINKVLSQLKEDYEYCSPVTIDNYEHVLCSITSYYDVLNIVRNVSRKRKAQIHVGGPGVNNIRGYLDYIDTAWFGRCDNGEINGIVNGKEYKSLFRKKHDPEFTNTYEVCASTPELIGHSGNKETSMGCPKKCYFCHYSWWNKYVSKEEESYKSGQSYYEDFFQSLDWNRGHILTAMDGMTEETRRKVNKPLSICQIKNKLLESNKIKNRKKQFVVKVYSIIGYPWEDKNEISKCDLIKALKEVKLNNKLLMFFHLSHFVPMQKTPFWKLPFNFSNYAAMARSDPLLFENDNVKLYTGTSTTSPGSAGEELIIQRATNKDSSIIEIISSKKWQSLRVANKIKIYKTELFRLFTEQKSEAIENIKTPYNYNIKGVLDGL